MRKRFGWRQTVLAATLVAAPIGSVYWSLSSEDYPHRIGLPLRIRQVVYQGKQPFYELADRDTTYIEASVDTAEMSNFLLTRDKTNAHLNSYCDTPSVGRASYQSLIQNNEKFFPPYTPTTGCGKLRTKGSSGMKYRSKYAYQAVNAKEYRLFVASIALSND